MPLIMILILRVILLLSFLILVSAKINVCYNDRLCSKYHRCTSIIDPRERIHRILGQCRQACTNSFGCQKMNEKCIYGGFMFLDNWNSSHDPGQPVPIG